MTLAPPSLATRSVLALVLLTLIGCAGGGPESGPVTLVFKYARILGNADPLPGLLRAFEAAHPGVRVKGEALPWTSDDQHQFYVINLEGRSPGFDVMMLDCIWVPEFARAGWLLDLTSRVAPDELAPYFSSTVAAATYGGRVWALPWNFNVGLLYYRADLLAKYGFRPPETYDELVAQVHRIRAEERDPRSTATSGRASSTRGSSSTFWRPSGRTAPGSWRTTARSFPIRSGPPTRCDSCAA